MVQCRATAGGDWLRPMALRRKDALDDEGRAGENIVRICAVGEKGAPAEKGKGMAGGRCSCCYDGVVWGVGGEVGGG